MTMPKGGKTFVHVTGKKYDGMMGRCYREKDPSYENYGGRGILVCTAWIKDIDSFREWVIQELIRLKVDLEFFVNNAKKFQVDRIDVNGHYTPQNCRLASPQQNSRNTRITGGKILTSAEGEEIEI